jgi:hypothetical protein
MLKHNLLLLQIEQRRFPHLWTFRFDNPRGIRHNPGMEEDLDQSAETSLPAESLRESSLLSTSSPVEYYQPPRLGIIHFLAWMTLAAVLLSLNCSVYLDPYGPFSQHQTLLKICQTAVDIILAALLVGGSVLLADCFRRKSGAFQPGHWILSISALQFSAEWVIFYLHRRFTASSPFNPNRTNLSVALEVSLFLIAILYRWGTGKSIERGPWKWILGLLAARYLCDCLLVLSFQTGLIALIPFWIFVVYFFYLPLVGLLIFAKMRDFYKRIRRDWLHSLGATAFLAMLILHDLILGAGFSSCRW